MYNEFIIIESITIQSQFICKCFHSLQNSNTVHWSVYNMACPGNRMKWDLNAEDIGRKAEELMSKSKAIYDSVGAVKPEEANMENVVKVKL